MGLPLLANIYIITIAISLHHYNIALACLTDTLHPTSFIIILLKIHNHKYSSSMVSTAEKHEYYYSVYMYSSGYFVF